jgi:fructose-specific phosphotransferase system IIC component
MSYVKNQETTQEVYGVEAEAVSQQQAEDTPDLLEKLGSKRQVKGAAVAGGMTGFVLLGPAAAVLAAGGAVLATSGKGEIGKAARATGDTVSDLGKSLKKFDEKHNISKKTAKGIVKGCDWVSKRLKDKS